MNPRKDKLRSTMGKIVWLSLLLTFAAQVVLVYIGITYADSLDKSMSAKRTEAMLNQFQQNLLYQLNDINNLLLLFQTPDFSDFFKNNMNLRDPAEVERAKRQLFNQLDDLELSPDIIQSVYFLGKDGNQRSYLFRSGASEFEELPLLRMETLQRTRLENLFLPDHDQFVRYSDADLKTRLRTDNPLLDPDDIRETELFMADIQEHAILSNVNENGVFILIKLNDKLFEQAVPFAKTGTKYSAVDLKGRLLWSSGGSSFKETEVGYERTVKELPPYRLRILFSERQTGSSLFGSALVWKMTVLSVLTLLLTLFISFFYLRKVFAPFRILSRKLGSQAITSELGLRALPEDMIKKGFQSISLRNKLILALIAAVSIPTLSDGVLYSRFLNQDVDRKMETFVEETGQASVTSIRNRVRFMENVANEIAVSQGFQDYITYGYELEQLPTSLSGQNTINLTKFPGLNDVSYFVLLDERGTCIYSSIYSNNKDIFNTNSEYLQDRDDPYWISDFKDVFKHTSTAVVKRILPHDPQFPVTYLMLVPKDTLFENVESRLIHASYTISDRQGQTIYESRPLSDATAGEPHRYQSVVPNTRWTIAIETYFDEVADKNRVYQDQFLLCIFIVLFVSIAAAIIIANLLARPIKQIKETMLAVGAGDLSQTVFYDGHNEIGDIVRSYNRMVGQLEQTIRQNMSIMEENAQNKIREQDLVSMKARAELQMLQAQINPHFLYNTLEAINMRSMKSGNHEISAIVGALADLFRYSVSLEGDTAPLGKELGHASNYLTIQQIRFGHSFAVDVDVPAEAESLPVLRFILQPVLENAIKHGFEGWDSGGLIRISAAIDSGRLRLTVGDNGNGMSERALSRLRAELEEQPVRRKAEEGGIGLHNVYQRLKLYYGEKMAMQVFSRPMEGTEIVIDVPLPANEA